MYCSTAHAHERERELYSPTTHSTRLLKLAKSDQIETSTYHTISLP